MKAKILLVLFLGLMMSACELLTEPELDNQFKEDRVQKDAAFAEGILLQAYLLLPTEYSFEEVATDDAVTNNRGSGYLRMATGEWSPQFNPLDNWGTAYDAIFNLNYFLSVVDEVEWSWQDEERNELFRQRFKGEALALRGYFYFMLLERFGGVAENGDLLGVPLVTEVIKSDENWEVPRSSYQECINKIHADFDEAISLLPYQWIDLDSETHSDAQKRTQGEMNQNRVTAAIVRALKAKVALHAASPAFNPSGATDQYILAATTAGALLDSIGFVVPAGGHKFYDSDGDANSQEIFWRSNFFNSNYREALNFPPSMFGEGTVNPSQNLVDAFPMQNGYPITDGASGYDAANPYANRDPRLAAYIVYDGNKVGNNTIETDIASPLDGINKVPDFSTRTGYYLLKLLRPDVNMAPGTVNSRRHFYTHIRWTELFLIYAEAANEAWGPDADPNGIGITARGVIQAIRQRAGITQPDAYLASISTTEEMRELIRNERRLELSFEGFRFWDLRRWQENLTDPARGVIIDGTNYTYTEVEDRVYPSHAIYGPVPLIETLKYDALLQNQGW